MLPSYLLFALYYVFLVQRLLVLLMGTYFGSPSMPLIFLIMLVLLILRLMISLLNLILDNLLQINTFDRSYFVSHCCWYLGLFNHYMSRYCLYCTHCEAFSNTELANNPIDRRSTVKNKIWFLDFLQKLSIESCHLLPLRQFGYDDYLYIWVFLFLI